ncbi:MAG: sulfatase, partial [Pseudomonadota bacterium]
RGVQGRSLWPLLTGADYPADEFDSAYIEQGFGGLHYTANDDYDRNADGLSEYIGFDELNGVSQSGTMRALRHGEWKLIFDMQEHGQLYNLADDPVELNNLFGQPACADIQSTLLTKLMGWTLRVQDPLPHPRRRYRFKSDQRNYWSPHRPS